MAVPKYNETYRSFLEAIADGKNYRFREIVNSVAISMNISEEDLREMVPSQTQTRFYNNVSWASTYLKRAGLIQSPTRGYFAITERGKKALLDTAAVIDNQYLGQFESFVEFTSNNNSATSQPKSIPQDSEDETPLEQLENAVKQMNKKLADELLDEIMKQSPAFFEQLVVNLLTKMGYGGSIADAGKVTGKSGDEGIDGIIREDKLGFNLIYIQAKRLDPEKTVGRPEIQAFVGALAGQGATKGLFVTTAKYTSEAKKYVGKQHATKVILLDGEALCKLMIEYDLGVSVETTYALKKIDMDYFEENLL